MTQVYDVVIVVARIERPAEREAGFVPADRHVLQLIVLLAVRVQSARIVRVRVLGQKTGKTLVSEKAGMSYQSKASSIMPDTFGRN